MRIILTGPPGSGKTTVLRSPELNTQFTIFTECARMVLRRPTLFGTGEAPQLIIESMQRNQYEDAELSVRHCIFDRGLPDQVAYRRYLGHDVPTSLLDACDEFRYDKVFFFPAWGDIYEQDDVRTETFTQAVAIGNAIKTTYELLGYDVIIVPKATAQQRVNFIMSKI